MDEIEAGATEAAATTDQAAGQVEQSTTTVAGIEVQADSRVAVGVARSDVVEIRIVDTDIVLILADGRRIFIRDGAVQAVIDPNFVVAFADGVEEAGQSLIQSAGSSEIGRVALSGPMGGQEETVVVVQVPVPMPVAPPIPAAAADGGAASGAQSSGSGSGSGVRPWQTWAMIGTPLLGGLLGASGGGSTSSGSTLTTVPTPVIFALTGDNNVTGLERDSGITVSGTAQANATVQVSWGASPAKSATADASGNWSVFFQASEVPADGSAVSLSATAIVNGVQSDPASRDVVVDTTGPAAPQINLVSGDDFVGPTDRAGTVTISGTAEANSRITVNFGTVTRFANVDNLGTWSVSVPGSELPNPGTYNVTAVAVDTAGNIGTTGTRTVTVIPSVTVTGQVTAGPVASGNDLVVDIYRGNGQPLATAVDVADDGTFSVADLSLNIGEVVIVRVRSIGAASDYRDEATNALVDLGSATLMSVAVVASADKPLVANVNPLTSLVALEAGATTSGTPTVSASSAASANSRVATAFGLAGEQLETILPVTTNRSSGGNNPAFNLADTISSPEKVGAILAAFSGIDSANAGVVQKTIQDLSLGLGQDGTFSIDSLSALMRGASAADSQVSGNLQSLISDLTTVPSVGNRSVTLGSVATDNIINATEINGTIVFSGKVTAGATRVTLSFGGAGMEAAISPSQSGGTTADWTYTPTQAELNQLRSAGPKNISVEAQFTDGSTVSSVSVVRTVMVDLTAPLRPTIGLVSGNDTISLDEAKNSVTVTGTGEIGTEIFVTWGSVTLSGFPTGNADAQGRASWAITFSAAQLPKGFSTTEISVRSVDSAGNVTSGTPKTVEFDTIDPTVKLMDGSTVDSDGISLAQNLTFKVSGPSGSVVQLFDDKNNDDILDAGEALGPSVTLTGDPEILEGDERIETTISFNSNEPSVIYNLKGKFTATLSGIEAITAPQRIEVDTVATTPTVTLATSSDTGIAGDNITNSQTISFNVTGEGGATVVLFNDANNDGEQNAAVLDDEGNVITAGEETLAEVTLSGNRNDPSTGTLTIPNNKAPEGTWSNLKVKLTDTIGNVATSTTNVVVTVDRTGPTDAQTTLTLDAASDTGASNSDGLTADNTPSFTVQSEGGSTVVLFNDDNDNGEVDDGEQIGADVTLTGTRGETVSGQIVVETELADKNYDKLKLKVTDIVGNVLTKSVTGFEVDTTGPDAPTVTFKDENDGNGPFSAPSRIFVGGTAEANSTVYVSWQGFAERAVSVDGDGKWSFEVAATDFPTTFGSVTVTAYAKDALDNQSASVTSDIDIDTVAVVPTVTLAANMDSGSNSTDLVTNLANIVFDVTGEGGATISLFNDTDNDGVQDANEATLGSTTLSGVRNSAANGTITIGSAVAVDGTSWQNLRVKLVDEIGNVRHSAVTDPEVKITVDRSAPTDAQTTLTLTGGQDAGATFGLGRTTDTTPTFNFSSEGGSVVKLFLDNDTIAGFSAGDVLIGETTLSGGLGTTQNGSVTSGPLADGLYSNVKLQVTDVVGNVQTKSFANFTIDTGSPLPEFTVTRGASTGPFDRSAAVVISGTAEANSTVTVTWKSLSRQVSTDGTGNWSTTVDAADLPISVGTLGVTAVAVDGLGNTSATKTVNVELSMSSTELGALTATQFATLTSSELTALTSSAMAGLTAAQLATLDATEVAALGADIAGIPSTLAASITATQAAALTTGQLAALSTAQVAQLGATAVGALNATQLNALNTAGLLDDLAHPLTQAQFSGLGYTNIDTTAEVNLFNSVLDSFAGNTGARDLNSISAGVSAVIGSVSAGGSTLSLAHLEALNLQAGNSVQMRPDAENLSRIQAAVDKVGESTAFFDTVSELRRLVAFADADISGGTFNLGTIVRPGMPANTDLTLLRPVLIEGKLYGQVTLSGISNRVTQAQWEGYLGSNIFTGSEFNLSNPDGTIWTLRVPGIVGTIATNVPRDSNGDLNPNSLPTGDDWVAIRHSLNGMLPGQNGNPHLTSQTIGGVLQHTGLYSGNASASFNVDPNAMYLLVVELVL